MLPELSGFNEYIHKSMQALKVQGAAIGIVKDNQVVHLQGYGLRDVKQQLPVDADTVFAIGSASKAFTALCLGLLVDQGKLEWDKPVREYLPTFKLHDPFATERMTPRDLVCHRSGLPRHDLMWYGTPKTRQELVDRLQYLEPNKDFRTYLQYQNLMFMTAGYLVELVSGKTWEEFTRQEILERLGMNRSSLSVEGIIGAENVSLPYHEKKNKVEEMPYRNIDTVGPAGSINSSLNDMLRWLMLHMNDGKAGETQLISKAGIDETHTPQMVVTGAFFGSIEKYPEYGAPGSYGMGWFINTYQGRKMIHHGGNIDGFSSLVSFMPQEKLGVVVLTNMNGTSLPFLSTFNAYDRLLGLKPVPWLERVKKEEKEAKAALKAGKAKSEVKKVRGTRPSHPLQAYTGQYEHPGYGVITIRKEEAGLAAEYNGLEFDLKHYHYDIFELKYEQLELSLKVSFATDVQGAIASFSAPLEPSVKDIVFTRIPEQQMSEKGFLERFAGDYDLMGRDLTVSLRKDTTLFAVISGQPELELAPYQGTTFKVKNIPAISLEFKLEDGKVAAVEIDQMGAVFTAKKK
ncbi:MAG: serine hydrolase [Chloroflexi bacterium]|nr:serine hydrolase [Chloroflexota bacterium]